MLSSGAEKCLDILSAADKVTPTRIIKLSAHLYFITAYDNQCTATRDVQEGPVAKPTENQHLAIESATSISPSRQD